MCSLMGSELLHKLQTISQTEEKTMNQNKWQLVNDDVLALPVHEFLTVMDDAITNGFTIIIKDGKLYYCDEVDADE